MELDDTLINRLEGLVRLELSSTERQQIKKDLEEILDMFKVLDEVDLDEFPEMMSTSPVVSVFREDEVGHHLEWDKVKNNAPQVKDHRWVVPKVKPS